MTVHRRLRSRPLGLVLIAVALWIAVVVPVATMGRPASAATASATACPTATAPLTPPSADTLFGEGGSPAEPMTNELIEDDTVGLGSMSASYFDTNINTGQQDFAGGDSDFGVSELPLSSANAALAAANCRSFAYVPFAAQGVAIAAILICNTNAQGSDVQEAFCDNVQLTALQVEGLFTGHIATWSDASNLGDISPLSGGGLGPVPVAPEFKNVSAEVEVDPTANNEVLESYFDNDATAGPLYQGWAEGVIAGGSGTPSVLWPTETGVSGGDLGLANQLMPLDEVTLQPDPDPSSWESGGDVGALPVDWLSTPRYIPALAIQNAAGSFVQPTQSAEQAAVNDASIDPKTNLVTFEPNGGTDASAYPMMMMSYLVVPTTGLSAAKATPLSQFIDFVLSPEGTKDIEALGGVPVTSAMATAGQAVATTVAAEAGPVTTTTTTTTTPGSTGTSSTSSSNNSTSNGSSPGSSSDASFASDGSATGAGDDGVSLAMTGGDPLPIGILGLVLGVVGFGLRRRLRRSFRALR